MRSAVFVAIVLVSGTSAGMVYGAVSLATIGPYLDDAIDIENRNLFASGEREDTPEFWAEHDLYRDWQKGGQVLTSTILGTSVGALFGIVYAMSRNALPGEHDVKKALVLAGMMWLVVFLVPFLKYPGNLPGSGGDAVVLKATLHLAFTAISGISAVGFYRLSKRFGGWRKLVSAAGYGALISTVAFLMPGVPDVGGSPADLVSEFRAASVLGMSVFWVTIPLVLGILWHKFRPDCPIHRPAR